MGVSLALSRIRVTLAPGDYQDSKGQQKRCYSQSDLSGTAQTRYMPCEAQQNLGRVWIDLESRGNAGLRLSVDGILRPAERER